MGILREMIKNDYMCLLTNFLSNSLYTWHVVSNSLFATLFRKNVIIYSQEYAS